jgi:hypothetical protein
VLMVEFMQQGATMSEVYCEALKNKKHNKRHRMLTSSVVLLHDNTRLHTAACTRALLEHFNWELFDHPLYSPDFTQSNYHLLPTRGTGINIPLSQTFRSYLLTGVVLAVIQYNRPAWHTFSSSPCL